MGVTWIEHSNKKVLLVDFTGSILEQNMIHLVHTLPPFLTDVGDDTILALTDITGCFATPGFVAAARKINNEVFDNFKIKQAIVGVVGAKVILLKAHNLLVKNKIIPFPNREEALDYLTA